jgi:hypothetical protein
VNSAPSISFNATTDPAVNGVSSGIDHYDVYRDNVKVNKTALVGAGPFTWTDNTSQSLDPALVSNLYSYTVRAVDGVGRGFSASRDHAGRGTATDRGVAAAIRERRNVAAHRHGRSGLASVQPATALTDRRLHGHRGTGHGPAVRPLVRHDRCRRRSTRSLASDAREHARRLSPACSSTTPPDHPAKPLGAVTVVEADDHRVLRPIQGVRVRRQHYDVFRAGVRRGSTQPDPGRPLHLSGTTGSSNSRP